MQLSPISAPLTGALNGPQTVRRDVLMQKAKDLEAAFLSEMLSYAGVDGQQGPFSGGVGEDQYASFLRETQAKAIVDHGGIGLAEKLFQSLTRLDHAPD